MSQVVIFGSSGLIGRNLMKSLSTGGSRATLFHPSREEIHALGEADFWPRLSRDAPTTVFYCHGPTDPAIDSTELRRYHVTLPKEWFRLFARETMLVRFVTLGSVQETQIEITAKNPYLAAKAEWLAARTDLDSRSVHFQLHTVYGRPIRPRSFLGQMKRAIENRDEFQMSDGYQMREYQDVVDISAILSEVTESRWESEAGNTLTISHGNPISLRDLASGVFAHFHATKLLKIGALPTPEGDRGIPATAAGIATIRIPYRPTVEEIVALMKEEGVTGF